MSKLTSARAGVPKARRKHPIHLRGVGKNPKREWKPGPLIVERPVRRARHEYAKRQAALSHKPVHWREFL